jgi:hypothetical protein
MPIDLMVDVVRTVADMMTAENSDNGGRSAVDREMRRLLGGRS